MDDLIAEFLVEAGENLDVIDAELVRFEANPNERGTLNTIFRLLHTVKGTCGFLGLPRLEKVAHAGETLLDAFRSDRLPITEEAVTAVLASIDRIKLIMAGLAEAGVEVAGDDSELIKQLEALARGETLRGPVVVVSAPEPEPEIVEELVSQIEDEPVATPMDDLDALFASTPGPEYELTPEAAFEEPAEVSAPVVAPAAAPAAPVKARAHASSDELAGDKEARRPSGDPSSQSVRVDVDVLEGMMTLVSELVLTRNQLLQLSRQGVGGAFSTPLQRLSTITAELQESVMQTRMQPIGNAWKKLPRLIRDLSNDLGKKIDLVLDGEATELDRQLLEVIKDPLTHMVRNSADHGIESAAERIAAGKPPGGVIKLSAFHQGGSIVIRLEDDGKGLDTARIKAKAVERGILTRAEADALSDAHTFRLIFAPGFSTAEAVTAVSGRGVGMDVVRSNIEQIGGQVEATSVLGKGACFTIKIPLTLAIMPALVIGAAGHRFALPQGAVTELVRAGGEAEHQIETLNGVQLLRLRDELLPLVALATSLELPVTEHQTAYVVVMQVGSHRFGVAVDQILDTEEIVVKPLASTLRENGHYSGATILGDGSVILILEPNTLAALAGDAPAASDEDIRGAALARREGVQSLLLVRCGHEALKVVPLAQVSRLEHAKAESLEFSDGQAILQYRGRMMPVTVAPDASLRTSGIQPILVINGEGFTMGLAVDQIVDMVEDRIVLEMAPSRSGFLGSALVAGQTVEVVDIDYFLRDARRSISAEVLDAHARNIEQGVAA